MPVLPPVASTIVIPGASTPRRSASSINATARRSLTLPHGLRISSLAATRPGRSSPSCRSSTSGVRPTVAVKSRCNRPRSDSENTPSSSRISQTRSMDKPATLHRPAGRRDHARTPPTQPHEPREGGVAGGRLPPSSSPKAGARSGVQNSLPAHAESVDARGSDPGADASIRPRQRARCRRSDSPQNGWPDNKSNRAEGADEVPVSPTSGRLP